MNWSYNKEDGRYYVENASISYTNFTGAENDMNKAGKRNFKLRLDETLYNELVGQSVQASMRPPRNEDEDPLYSVKVGVYPNTKVFLLGKNKTKIEYEDLSLIDDEVSAGQVRNGEIDISFHVSVNRQLTRPAYYLRADEIYIPIRQSRFNKKYEHYGEQDEPGNPFED